MKNYLIKGDLRATLNYTGGRIIDSPFYFNTFPKFSYFKDLLITNSSIIRVLMGKSSLFFENVTFDL